MEIRELARRGRSLAATKAPSKLVDAANYHFGSWKQAIESVGIDYDTVLASPRYTDDELLDVLRTLARLYPEMTLGELGRDGRVHTWCKRFGSLPAAAARAGISGWPIVVQNRHWTKEALIAELRDLDRCGLTANADPKLYPVATRLFGSYAAAAAAAGIDAQIHRSWSRRDVVAALRAIDREHGIVTRRLAQDAGCRVAVEKHFGTIAKACEELGLRNKVVALSREHARQDDRGAMLDRLRAEAARTDRPVRVEDVPHALQRALLRHFDSFDDARTAAGLPAPEPPRIWTRASVVAELRREARRGTRLTTTGLAAANSRLLAAIHGVIGSLPKARRIAGVAEPKPLPRRKEAFRKEWDEARIVDEILQLAATEQSLAYSRVSVPLTSAAYRYFGGWRAAVEAAGFDYNDVALVRAYEDGELLDILRELAAEQPKLTLTELNSMPIAGSLQRRYGGAENASREAGLRDWPVRVAFPRMPRQVVRRALRERVTSDEPMTRAKVAAEHPRLVYGASRVHPRWREAISRMGVRERSRASDRARARRGPRARSGGTKGS